MTSFCHCNETLLNKLTPSVLEKITLIPCKVMGKHKMKARSLKIREKKRQRTSPAFLNTDITIV